MQGKIIVVNKKTHQECDCCIYAGRPSILGNPFVMSNESQRQTVVDKYNVFLQEELKKTNKEAAIGYKPSILYETLYNLAVRFNRGSEIHLMCFCSPKACHLDATKKAIEQLAMNIKEKL